MLLAQPFDPFKPQRKAPFFVRNRLFSRTRRALLSLKNKMHNDNRQYQPVMMPDHHFMLPPQQILPPLPPPSSWYCCYNDCYDPFQPPVLFPSPLPPPPSLYPTIHPVQIPYCICIHISAPPPPTEHHKDTALQNESTLYNSSNSSVYSCNEKMEQEEGYYRDNYPALTQSDILLEKTDAHHQRPSFHRWNSSNNYNNYNYHHE